MNREEQAKVIAMAIADLKRDLEKLEQAGRGIPAVEKNVVRMSGALRQLTVQFEYLAQL